MIAATTLALIATALLAYRQGQRHPADARIQWPDTQALAQDPAPPAHPAPSYGAHHVLAAQELMARGHSLRSALHIVTSAQAAQAAHAARLPGARATSAANDDQLLGPATTAAVWEA